MKKQLFGDGSENYYLQVKKNYYLQVKKNYYLQVWNLAGCATLPPFYSFFYDLIDLVRPTQYKKLRSGYYSSRLLVLKRRWSFN